MNLPIKLRRKARKEKYILKEGAAAGEGLCSSCCFNFHVSYLFFSFPLPSPCFLKLGFLPDLPLLEISKPIAKYPPTSLTCHRWLCQAANLRDRISLGFSVFYVTFWHPPFWLTSLMILFHITNDVLELPVFILLCVEAKAWHAFLGCPSTLWHSSLEK